MSDRIVTLPDEVAALVDGAIESEQFESDQALFRAAVEEYFDRHDEARVDAAVGLYAAERVSMGRAAEIAGVHRLEMEEIVADRGVTVRKRPNAGAGSGGEAAARAIIAPTDGSDDE